MTATGSLYRRRRKEPQNLASVPPLPKVPEFHPERPPPHIPIPGEPSPGEPEEQLYKCHLCGAVFGSKNELDLHMATDHSKKETPKKKSNTNTKNQKKKKEKREKAS
jgi:uncharacterized C2H2 Zn-finger protein